MNDSVHNKLRMELGPDCYRNLKML